MSDEDLDRIRSIRTRFEAYRDEALGYGLPKSMAESLSLERIGTESIDAIDKLLAELDAVQGGK